MKWLIVSVFSISLLFIGCVHTDPGIRSPLMDDSGFGDFEMLNIATNDSITNVSIVVSNL